MATGLTKAHVLHIPKIFFLIPHEEITKYPHCMREQDKTYLIAPLGAYKWS